MNDLQRNIIASAIDEITAGADGTITRRYLFAPDFIGFSGHFPGHPIVPAVVQLLTVVSLAGEHAGRLLRLVAVEDAKFLLPISPDQEILVACRIRTVGGKPMYDARLTVGEKQAATFLIELADREEQS